VVVFPPLFPGEEHFSYKENLLIKSELDHYRLYDPETRLSYLLYPSEKGYTHYKLTAIENPQGHRITIEYDNKGYLARITDSVGRILDITTDNTGRITKVAIGTRVLVQYKYSYEGDLNEVIDAVGQSAKMSHNDHLIIKKTDRNKNSFYWQYDKSGERPRVT